MDVTLSNQAFTATKNSLSNAQSLEFKKTRLTYWNSKRRYH